MTIYRLQRQVEAQNVELQEKNDALEAALVQVKLLSGMLPICANCKKIRNDEGYWQEVTTYIQEHSDAEFTHGICSDCLPKLYPEIYGEGEMEE